MLLLTKCQFFVMAAAKCYMPKRLEIKFIKDIYERFDGRFIVCGWSRSERHTCCPG